MERRVRPLLFSDPNGSIKYWFVYLLSVIFVYHTSIVSYSNSSFMEQYVTPTGVGALFTIGSALSVFGFVFISRMLRHTGNVLLTMWLVLIEILALLTLAVTNHDATAIVAFVVFLTFNPLIYLNIDIFSETLIGDEEYDTGKKRGLTLSLISLAALAGPLTMGYLVGDNVAELNDTYLLSAGVFSLFLVIVLLKFRRFQDPLYSEVKVVDTLQRFWQEPDLRNVLVVHFGLQMFFSWMVIYVPLYLATVVGMNWGEIGSIIAVGLFAYLVFEYPIGLIADRYIGEKEMMAVGIMLLAVTASWMSFMTTAGVAAWMMLMFVSRTGASLVEATTESYFFKHTEGSDANVISFFRLTRPLAIVAGSLIGSMALLYLPFNLIFVVLGIVLVPGIFFTMALRDTK